MSAVPDGMHYCPVKGCVIAVSNTMLMCARHWRRVPRATALELYREYRKAPGSREHVAVCKKAVAEVEAKS